MPSDPKPAAPREGPRAQDPDALATVRDFLERWPLGGYELEAYCDSTLVPALRSLAGGDAGHDSGGDVKGSKGGE